MDKVMYITNVTLTDDYENLYDDIWEAMDCDNGTTINIEVKIVIEKCFPADSTLTFFLLIGMGNAFGWKKPMWR